MTTAVRGLAGGEHVMYQRHPRRLHRFEEELRDGCEIMRFGMERPIVAMGFLVGLKPWLVVECLGLTVSDSTQNTRV